MKEQPGAAGPVKTPDAGDEFLAKAAAKHFLTLGFKVTKPDGTAVLETRSSFVVEIRGLWLLITAGHIVRNLCRYKEQGFELSNFLLQEILDLGLELPVPMVFDPHECLFIDQDCGDYAAWQLNDNEVRLLKAGGIEPVNIANIKGEPKDYPVLALVGIPTESLEQVRSDRHVFQVAMIPLALIDHDLTEDEREQGLHRAQLLQQPVALVRDIDGMSGGPIFGVRRLPAETQYTIVGVQSGWFRESRITTFFEIHRLMFALDRMIERRMATEPEPPQSADEVASE